MPAKSTLRETQSPGADGKPYLLVLGADTFATFELPEDGAVLIGRRPGVHVFLDDPLVSAEHALLSVNGDAFIEDLGSRNGTFVGEERVPERVRRALPFNTAIAIGGCLLIAQMPRQRRDTRRVLSYGFFRFRLDEELARAKWDPSRRFSVARIQLTGPSAADRLAACAGRALRPFDTIAAYGPEDFVVLFSATPAEEARRLVSELCGALGTEGASVRYGLARYPDDGTSAAALESAGSRSLRPGLHGVDLDADVVAASPTMQELYRRADRVARSRLSILIAGETGSGKDVLARWIHARSQRSERPFQAINCAALPEALLEAQLFGYQRGAFTGATRNQQGLIETADGGTVFLDEIAEVPLAVQAKLLRLLENGEIQPLGATGPQKVDVRFIAATHEDLVQASADGRFRRDLLYRLVGLTLRVPPLRERRDDILPLAHRMLARFGALERRAAIPTLSASAEEMLLAQSWPGNVRELGNVLYRALVLAEGPAILDRDLFFDGNDASPVQTSDAAPPSPEESAERYTKRSERAGNPTSNEVAEALATCGGNQTRAAQILGVPRARLRDLIARYQLPKPRI